MRHRRYSSLLSASVLVVSASAADSPDAQWLTSKGQRIFHDTFAREEDGNLAKAIGNGWNSATADRVPHIKMADLPMAASVSDSGFPDSPPTNPSSSDSLTEKQKESTPDTSATPTSPPALPRSWTGKPA
jgi:hypothetical protein